MNLHLSPSQAELLAGRAGTASLSPRMDLLLRSVKEISDPIFRLQYLDAFVAEYAKQQPKGWFTEEQKGALKGHGAAVVDAVLDVETQYWDILKTVYAEWIDTAQSPLLPQTLARDSLSRLRALSTKEHLGRYSKEFLELPKTPFGPRGAPIPRDPAEQEVRKRAENEHARERVTLDLEQQERFERDLERAEKERGEKERADRERQERDKAESEREKREREDRERLEEDQQAVKELEMQMDEELRRELELNQAVTEEQRERRKKRRKEKEMLDLVVEKQQAPKKEVAVVEEGEVRRTPQSSPVREPLEEGQLSQEPLADERTQHRIVPPPVLPQETESFGHWLGRSLVPVPNVARVEHVDHKAAFYESQAGPLPPPLPRETRKASWHERSPERDRMREREQDWTGEKGRDRYDRYDRYDRDRNDRDQNLWQEQAPHREWTRYQRERDHTNSGNNRDHLRERDNDRTKAGSRTQSWGGESVQSMQGRPWNRPAGERERIRSNGLDRDGWGQSYKRERDRE